MIENWFLNLLICNLIEREIKREKVQMKPPKITSCERWKFFETLHEWKIYPWNPKDPKICVENIKKNELEWLDWKWEKCRNVQCTKCYMYHHTNSKIWFFSGARVFCLYQYNLCNGHFSKDKGQSKYATLQIFLIKRLQF